VEPVDLSPVEMECIRCRQVEAMRFYGMCEPCRAELLARFEREGRVIAVPEYEPRTNVTPNAVALKAD
jgi:hypothetical protein